jgi:hypothetical protein
LVRSADFVSEIQAVGRHVRPLAGDERDDDQLSGEYQPREGASKREATREHTSPNATGSPTSGRTER